MEHVNPSGYWEHQGSYSVRLTDDAKIDRLPSSVNIYGRMVCVNSGRIKQVPGGIQFYSLETPFSCV